VFLIRWIIQTAALAVGQLNAHKVRATLTMVGIIIAVASVATVVAALEGLRGFVLEQFETVGTRYVVIDGDRPPELRNKIGWRDVQLKLEEVVALRDNASTIDAITPIWGQSANVSYGMETLQGVRVQGIWPEWHEIEQRSVIQGRPFVSIDDDERRNVCLINDKAIEELGLDKEPVGQFIIVGNQRCQIVGVVETKEVAPMFGGGQPQTEVFLPFETARKMWPYQVIRHAAALMVDESMSEEVQAEVAFILRSLRDLEPGSPDTFEVEVVQVFLDQFQTVAAGITVVAGGIVSISLLVGGIGIMNIMLVSVSERTREIGLRKAVGARPAIILLQFLVEAVLLCVVGGAIGLAFAQGLTLGIRSVPDSPLSTAEVPTWAAVLALTFSAAVGVIFGLFPAVKAARLDPIEALRHE